MGIHWTVVVSCCNQEVNMGKETGGFQKTIAVFSLHVQMCLFFFLSLSDIIIIRTTSCCSDWLDKPVLIIDNRLIIGMNIAMHKK